MHKKNYMYKVTTYLCLTILLLFILLPYIWMLSSSLKESNAIFNIIPRWIPEKITFENYRWLITPLGPNFVLLTYNSFVIAIITSIITSIIASMGGYALGRFKFPGAVLIGISLLLSQMFQGPLIMVPWYRMAANLGILNTKLVLILIYGTSTIPIGVWLMMGFFKALPKELEEAALVDGATKVQTFSKVVFPLVKPGLVAIFMYSFIICWNDYQYALMLTSSQKGKTIQLGIAELIDSMGRANWGGIMASGVATTIPVIILFAIVQKHLIKGLTAGSIKG
jgi:multiple sugar transport system permease protein